MCYVCRETESVWVSLESMLETCSYLGSHNEISFAVKVSCLMLIIYLDDIESRIMRKLDFYIQEF